MKKATKAPKVEETKSEIKFTKVQIQKSYRYKEHIDLINTLLNDNQKYSILEVDTKIKEYLKGKVN